MHTLQPDPIPLYCQQYPPWSQQSDTFGYNTFSAFPHELSSQNIVRQELYACKADCLALFCMLESWSFEH